MVIMLTGDQAAWLDARVAAGEFASVEKAVHHLLDDLMDEAMDDDDLDWAKPLIEAARASVARGDVVSLEDHRTHTETLLKRLGAS